MSAFLITAVILALLVTAALLRPLLRTPATLAVLPDGKPESPALKILREQRADLEGEHDAGKISEESYAQTLAEIERRALEESAAPETASSSGPRLAWAVGVGALLPVSAITIYLLMGNVAGLDPKAAIAQQEPHVSSEEIDAMVAKVAERVKEHPDDIKALEMLGRSYMVLNRFDEAAKAFAQLAEKQPENAQVFADWADAAAGAQDKKLAGEPEKLIAKALAIDPQNVKALALSGTIAFDRKDYKQAAAQWQKILSSGVDTDSEFGKSVQSMIAEARTRGGMPAAKTEVAANAAAPAAPEPAALKLKGHVSISAALKSQVGADDTLFIFVRTLAAGPPVAGMRFKASELPLDFDLSKAQMMMGTVGPHDTLIVGARISKTGNPVATTGDLQGFSEQVTSTTSKLLRIEISEQVK